MLWCWTCHLFLCAINSQQIAPVKCKLLSSCNFRSCVFRVPLLIICLDTIHTINKYIFQHLSWSFGIRLKICLLLLEEVFAENQILVILCFCVTATSKFKSVLSQFPFWLILVAKVVSDGGCQNPPRKPGWDLFLKTVILFHNPAEQFCMLLSLMHCTPNVHEAVTKKVLYYSDCLCLQVEWVCLLFKLGLVWVRKDYLPIITVRQFSALINCPRKCKILITMQCLPCLNRDVLSDCPIEHSSFFEHLLQVYLLGSWASFIWWVWKSTSSHRLISRNVLEV